MFNKEDHIASEAESGFSNVKTQSGQTVRIFSLTAEDFERLKPREDILRRAADIMAVSKSDIETQPTQSKRPLSNKERLQRLVKG